MKDEQAAKLSINLKVSIKSLERFAEAMRKATEALNRLAKEHDDSDEWWREGGEPPEWQGAAEPNPFDADNWWLRGEEPPGSA